MQGDCNRVIAEYDVAQNAIVVLAIMHPKSGCTSLWCFLGTHLSTSFSLLLMPVLPQCDLQLQILVAVLPLCRSASALRVQQPKCDLLLGIIWISVQLKRRSKLLKMVSTTKEIFELKPRSIDRWRYFQLKRISIDTFEFKCI